MFKEPTINNKAEEINKLSHSELSPEVSNHINKLWQEADVISVELHNLQNEKKTNESLQQDTKLKNRLAAILNLITISKENNSVEEEKTETEYITEEKALDEIEKLLNTGAITAGSAAYSLAGLDSERAWEMREELAKTNKEAVASVLIRLDSERAWEMRDRFLREGANKGWVIKGLTGVDSERAWAMRDKFLNEGGSKKQALETLAGLDSEKAWLIRINTINNNDDEGPTLALSLVGLDSEKAWNMRDKLLTNINSKDDADWLAQCLVGLDSERAWQMRQKLSLIKINEGCLIYSLAGIDSEKAWAMRDKYLQERLDNNNRDRGLDFLARSLAGLDSEKAWAMRQKLLATKINPAWIAEGINGHGLAALAWRMKRDRELDSKK